MDILTKIKLVLTEPAHFFTKINKEKGIISAFRYLAILLLFSTIMSLIISYIFKPIDLIKKITGINLQIPTTTLSANLTASLLGYVVTLAFVFVIVAVLFVWIKIFKGKADYKKTYQIYIYGSTPSLLLSWIPLIGGLMWIYNLVLLIIGTSIIHKISKTRSTILYLIPTAVTIMLLIALIAILMVLSSSMPQLKETLATVNFN